MKLPISIGTLVININKKHGDYFTQGVVIPPAFKGDQFINVELKYYDGSTRISIAKPWELKELTNTPIGGRGTFPNGPDVLAINAYLTSGNAINATINLRWAEAQA